MESALKAGTWFQITQVNSPKIPSTLLSFLLNNNALNKSYLSPNKVLPAGVVFPGPQTECAALP